MESIAITKPDMGVLSRERLHLSPFGALAQAFAEELLARAEQQEGYWPFVPLELLEEGPESPISSAAPSNMTLQVDLRLVLEAMRREGNRTEQRQATERIVERILQLQSQRDHPPHPKQDTPKQSSTQSPTLLGTVQQTFQQNLTQNIRITAPIPPASAPQGQHTPGALARQAGLFSRQLQMLREEGKSLSTQSGLARGRMVRLPPQEDTLHPAPQTGSPEESFRSLPREALTLLEAQGQETAQAASGAQTANLLRTAARLEALVEDALGERVKFSPGKPLSVSEEASSPALHPVHPIQEPQRDTYSEARQAPQARDIRVNRETQFSSERGEQHPPTKGQRPPAISPPELSLRTELEESGTVPAPPGIPHTGWPSPQRARRTQPGLSAQSTGESGKGLSKGPQAPAHHMHPESSLSGTAPAQPTPAEEVGPPSSAASFPAPGEPASALPTAARDIRITPEIHLQNKSGGIPQSLQEIQETATRSQPPLELALQTEPEEAKGTDISGAPHPGRAASQAAHSGQPGSSGQPVKAPAAHHSGSEQAESPRQVSSQTARRGHPGIPVQPAKGPVAALTNSQFPGKVSPAKKGLPAETASHGADLSHLTAAEESAHRAMSAPQAAPMADASAAVPPTAARDIRMNRELHSISEPDEAPREFLDPAALSQLSLELSLRDEPEEAQTAPGTSGIPSVEKSARPAVRSGQSTRAVQSVRKPGERPLSQSELHIKGEPSVRKVSRGAVLSLPTSAREASHTEARFLGAISSADASARILPTTARDIRVRADVSHGSTAVSGQPAQGVPAHFGQFPKETLAHGEGQPGVASAAWPLPSTELALNQQAEPANILSPESFQPSPSESSPLRENAQRAAPPEPVTLTYGPTQPAPEPSAPPPAEGPAQARIPESDYVRSLPDWARRFLQTGGADSQVSRTMGVARDIASLPQPETGDTVEWTAPGYHPPQAPITYREKSREEQPREVREVRITDAEIQRTAHQVYRIIEDRIRRERRRLGL